MNQAVVFGICLALSLGGAHAEEPKADAKKSEKSKPAAKSEKNAAQKAEASLTDWANKNKIWITKQKKPAKKDD